MIAMSMFITKKILDGYGLTDTQGSLTVDLPRSNRICGIGYRLYGTGGSGTVNITGVISKVELEADTGSKIIDMSDLDLRNLMRLRQKGVPQELTQTTSGTTSITTEAMLGRYVHDKTVTLPAYKFSNLQLKFTFGTLVATTAFATGTVKLDVWTEEEIVTQADIPDVELVIQKMVQITNFTAATSGDKTVQLSRGHFIGALMIYAAGTDGTTISSIKVDLNNGSLTPFNLGWLNTQNRNLTRYALVGTSGAAKIANVAFVDFDNPDTEAVLQESIYTGRNSGVTAADLVLTQGAAQAVRVHQITFVPVAAII